MISPDFNKKLFEKELMVLEAAWNEIATGKHEKNELFPDYKDLVVNYEKLLTLTRKVIKISDLQGMNLIKRESELKNLLDNAGQGFLTFCKDLIINREYSAECVRIFGQKIGKMNILTLLYGDDSTQNELLASLFQSIWETSDVAEQHEYLNKLPKKITINERYLTLEFKLITPVDGNEQLIMLIITDVSERHKAQEQVVFLSYHDKLTSLYNRAYIEEWNSHFQPGEHFPLSVIMADVNGLKLANDIFGHVQGDLLLVKLAQVLLRCCRKNDIVARWGGDEFLVLLPRTDQEACKNIYHRIKEACVQEPAQPIELSVALGMATQQSSEGSIADLFNIAEERMYSNKLLESKQVRRRIVLGLNKILHTRLYEDEQHIERIKELSQSFALYLGFMMESIEMRQLNMLADLHDIGKVVVPREILGKPGPLTSGEWEIVKSHSETGYRMAQSIGETAVGEAILALHERWDEQGYPFGLKGEQIPLLARLLSIVDAYDVMTHDRPYRQALSKEEALKEIEKGSGTQFDTQLAKSFINYLAVHGKEGNAIHTD